MAKVSFTIPCEPVWTPGIYQLEVTDRVLGYDPVLGKDGPANRQWKELGDRTLYLRQLLEAAHQEGRHAFRAGDFAPETRIPESCLDLGVGTKDLAELLESLGADAEKALAHLASHNDRDVSALYLLSRILPFCRRYFNQGTAYDLFGEGALELGTLHARKITRAIAGDDSLDIDNTAGILPGNSYFLMDPDGGRLEEATVLSVLTETRIRFTTSLQITRSDGILSSASVPPGENGLAGGGGLIYLAGPTDILADADSGMLFAHRDNVTATGKLFWRGEKDTEWQEARQLESVKFYDGSIDDVWELPAVGGLRLRLEYAGENDWRLHYFALKACWNIIVPEVVRRPQTLEAKLSGASLVARGTAYASLWNLPQGGIDMRVSRAGDYDFEPLVFSLDEATAGMSALLPPSLTGCADLRVELRHRDCEGSCSRWSPAFDVEA